MEQRHPARGPRRQSADTMHPPASGDRPPARRFQPLRHVLVWATRPRPRITTNFSSRDKAGAGLFAPAAARCERRVFAPARGRLHRSSGTAARPGYAVHAQLTEARPDPCGARRTRPTDLNPLRIVGGRRGSAGASRSPDLGPPPALSFHAAFRKATASTSRPRLSACSSSCRDARDRGADRVPANGQLPLSIPPTRAGMG